MDIVKVLVVDDEDMIRDNLVAFLEDEGFEVVGAQSAEEALRLLEKSVVDVGVVDMRLPGMDGNAFIIKAHDIDKNMKFIIHTGSTDYVVPASLRQIGLSNSSVFKKPIHDMTILIGAIRKLADGSL